MYIAIDPGASEKNKTGLSGYATFTSDGALVEYDYVEEDDIKNKFLSDIRDDPVIVDAVICEDWQLRPDAAKRFYWSRMPTSKLIGWIEGACDLANIPFILQAPQIKTNGYKHWGKKSLPHSNPMNHAMDAVVHGRYYLIKQGIIKP